MPEENAPATEAKPESKSDKDFTRKEISILWQDSQPGSDDRKALLKRFQCLYEIYSDVN